MSFKRVFPFYVGATGALALCGTLAALALSPASIENRSASGYPVVSVMENDFVCRDGEAAGLMRNQDTGEVASGYPINIYDLTSVAEACGDAKMQNAHHQAEPWVRVWDKPIAPTGVYTCFLDGNLKDSGKAMSEERLKNAREVCSKIPAMLMSKHT